MIVTTLNEKTKNYRPYVCYMLKYLDGICVFSRSYTNTIFSSITTWNLSIPVWPLYHDYLKIVTRYTTNGICKQISFYKSTCKCNISEKNLHSITSIVFLNLWVPLTIYHVIVVYFDLNNLRGSLEFLTGLTFVYLLYSLSLC